MNNLSITTWNIQGEANITGYTFPKKIRPTLEKISTDIVALQECVLPERFFSETKIPKKYNIVSSEHNGQVSKGGEYNDSVILSKFPILKHWELKFPELGQNRTTENALVADIALKDKVIRVYNCHFPIFKVGPLVRMKMLLYIFEDAKKHNGPVIVCGDLNTGIPKPGFGRFIVKNWHREPQEHLSIEGKLLSYAEHELFYELVQKYGFTESHFPYSPTWSMFKTSKWQPWKLKLDWLMVKGFKVVQTKLGPYVSDHRPIEAVVRID